MAAVPWCGYEFSGAEPLEGWQAPRGGGIYAITYRKDNNDGSAAHAVVYFGESGDLSARGIGPSHEKHGCWMRAAGGRRLYVSIHAEEDEGARLAKERRMVSAWLPKCNGEARRTA